MCKPVYIGIFALYGGIVAAEMSIYLWSKEVTLKVSVIQRLFERRAGR